MSSSYATTTTTTITDTNDGASAAQSSGYASDASILNSSSISSQSSQPSSSNSSTTSSADLSNTIQAQSSGSSASTVTSNPGGEPEFKKLKSNHYQYNLNTNSFYYTTPSSINLTSADMYNPSGGAHNKDSIYLVHKKLEERIGGILCCTVCLDLPQTPIYQCTNGHLMCAGCFSHLLADARLKDEQSTCPNCRCDINKTSCVRNLAVEKAICELPASCAYCNVMYSRSCLDQHQREECYERPTKCIYEGIGCTWEGPFHELEIHSRQCNHPNKPGREILVFLQEREKQNEENKRSLVQLVNLLSYEKVFFNDLQFKQYKSDDITPKLYFETNKFVAFYQQFVIKARVNDNQKNPNLSLNRYLSYQLILKSKLPNSQQSLEFKFCILKGPLGEVHVNPSIQSFEFSQNKLETDYIKLNIDSQDCNKLLSSKTINFRFYIFQA